MLKIRDFIFEENWNNRQSCFMFFKADQGTTSSWAVDIGFVHGNFDGDEISPSLCINPIDTDKNSIMELTGTIFSAKTVEESEDREDSFYIYEHEPLVDYKVEILEISDEKAHIKCNGTLIVDGYADPCIKEKFEIDSWIPVIESAEDWEKYE